MRQKSLFFAFVLLAASLTATGCATLHEVDWGRVGVLTAVDAVAAGATEIALDIDGRGYYYNSSRMAREVIGHRIAAGQGYQRRLAGEIYGDCLRANGYYTPQSESFYFRVEQECYVRGAIVAFGPRILSGYGGYR